MIRGEREREGREGEGGGGGDRGSKNGNYTCNIAAQRLHVSLRTVCSTIYNSVRPPLRRNPSSCFFGTSPMSIML